MPANLRSSLLGIKLARYKARMAESQAKADQALASALAARAWSEVNQRLYEDFEAVDDILQKAEEDVRIWLGKINKLEFEIRAFEQESKDSNP